MNKSYTKSRLYFDSLKQNERTIIEPITTFKMMHKGSRVYSISKGPGVTPGTSLEDGPVYHAMSF